MGWLDKISDVGIQQKGVEYAVPQRIPDNHFYEVNNFVADNNLILDSYNNVADGGYFELNFQFS